MRKPKQPGTQRTVYIRGVPIDLHAQFKADCARRGITIRDGIIAAMREQLRKGK